MTWSKKIGSVKKLGRKSSSNKLPESCPRESLLGQKVADLGGDPDYSSSPTTTPTGTCAVYVGDERRRFVVPTGYLCHPLFKMLLEKASEEFGFSHKSGLVVPCSVATFEEVVSAVQCCSGRFAFPDLVLREVVNV